MATYEELHGKRVEVFDSDPTLDSSYEGQVWFNSTLGVNKTVVQIAAWHSIAPGIYTKNTAGGAGTTTAAVVYGGASSGGTVFHNETVEYNGSGFSISGNLGTARQDMGSCGTQTAALAVGGEASGNKTNVEHYDGSTWSEQTDIPTSDRGWGSFGIQTAAVMVGGIASPTAKCFEYNGSSWTSGGSLNDGRRLSSMGCGTETAGLVAGGDPNSNKTETYNGTAFSTANTLNTGRQQGKMSGPQTLGLCWGGETPSLTTATESFDGTSWTTSPATLGTAVKNQGGNKDNTSGTSALSVYGNTPSDTSAAEEYNASVNTVTAAAWSSGGNLNLGRHDAANSGTQTAGLFAGGKVYPNVFKNESEEYDGTSWSEGNNLGTARMASGAGTQTAGLAFAGTNGSPGSTGVQALTEEYDGSSWSESGDLSTARMNCGGAGLQTAAYAAGGIGSPNAINNLHEQYNGSTWSTATAMNTERSNMGSVGTTTAGLVFSGYTPPSYTFATSSEEWNGSAWTSGGTVATARYGLGSFGSQTDAIGFAGATPPNNNSAVTEGYDGTAFSNRPSLSTARMQFAPGGSYNSGSDGMAVGGSNAGNPMYTNTEEWTPKIETVTSKTLTTS